MVQAFFQALLHILLFLAVVFGLLAAAVFSSSRVTQAVFRRNVASYFSGMLGYLFIVTFVVAAGFLALRPQFFTNNLVSLDQLSEWFPMLLLFIVPAITMSVWADERRQGTDELLFTLPGSDRQILAGKYLAVLAVYTVALGFSQTLWVGLAAMGEPDWGLMHTTYFGYWLAGAALLSAGMFASVLTSSVTVAFVLGAAFCSLPVLIGYVAPFEFLRGLTLREQMRDFELGMFPLTGLLYFASFTALMLYLNLVFISRRHWSDSQQANMGAQYAVRTVALAAILISLNVVAGQAAYRADATAERIYSLSPTTRQLLAKIESEKPVTIQAFLSPEVPREYVPVRKQLIGLLREFKRIGGSRIDIRYVDVLPFSEEADEARHFGITPVRVLTERDGRRIEENIFLGAVFTSYYDEVIVPYFGPGSPLEYELTRSIHTISNAERRTVGILRTDAELMGSSGEWQIVTELKQQYNVEDVSADTSIDDQKYDVLIAVLPSSLTQPQMANFVRYVQKGRPVLIFDDPFPYVFNTRFGVANAPRQEKPRPGGMFGGAGGPSEPKADGGRATSLLDALEIAWDNGQIVWDAFNPHPEFFAIVPDEFLFISPQSGVSTAISPRSEITSGLQELFLAHAGTVRPRADSKLQFEPLLRTGVQSGLLDWEQFTADSFDPSRMQPTRRLVPNPQRVMDSLAHVLAAHITSTEKGGVNAVYVADIDLISDWFFHLRTQADSDLNFDNIAFVLNSVDVLAGDTSYLDLRKRRPRLRTLKTVERRTAESIRRRNENQEQADKEARQKLEAARERFEKQREEIQNDESLNEETRRLMLARIQATEQRRLEVDEANIERDKQKTVEQIKAETEREINTEIFKIRFSVIGALPLPAVLLGVLMLGLRLRDERRNIAPDRRVR